MTSATAAAAPDERRRTYVAAGLISVVVGVLGTRAFSGDDLDVYRAAGRTFLDGANPYTSSLPGTDIAFSYTPFSTVVFVPLAALARPVAFFLLLVGSLICLWFALGRVIDALWTDRDDVFRVKLTAAVAALLLIAEPVTENLGLGQMNALLMAMVIGDVMRRRPSKWQGAWIGFATAFKLTPGIYILYLLITRRFRAAATAIATFAATIALGFVVVPRGSVTYWLDGVGTDPRHIGQVDFIPNQSILGSLSRIVGYDAARPWWIALCLPVLACGCWLAVRIHRRWGDVGGIATMAFVACLVSPYSWSHHFIWFALPALMVARAAHRSNSLRLMVAAAVWSLPFFFGPFWAVERARGSGDRSFGEIVMGSSYTITAFVGLGIAAWLVTRPDSGTGHRDIADDQAGEVVAAR